MKKIRITKEFTFETGHALYGYDGKCRNVHGHSYKLAVTVIGTPINDTDNVKLGMVIDFGDAIGQKKSSAQITVHYEIEDLVGRQVMAVTNFPPRQIGPFMSEVLTLGFADDDGAIVLAAVDKTVPNGERLM